MAAKKPVRRVTKNKSGYRALRPEGSSPSAMAARDRVSQGESDRRKTWQRGKAQAKRDAVKRGAEGPKKSAPRKKK